MLAALALVVAACGSDGDSTGAATTGDSTEASSDTAEAPTEVTLAIVPSESSGAIEKQFEPLISYLSDQVGVDVKLIPSTSYAAVIEALRAETADLALLGPLSYVIATNNDVDLEVLGGQVPAKGIAPTYQSYGVVAGDSDITSLDEVAGKRVCYADPSSTSGYLYPSAALLEAGVDPQDDVDAVFAGGPDKAAIGVAKGQCDIGFSFDAMVEVLLPDAGQLKEGDVKVIWKSSPIPGSPMVVRSSIDDGTKALLREAVLNANLDVFREEGYCDPDPDSECGAGAYGFGEVPESKYDEVREACATTELEACLKP